MNLMRHIELFILGLMHRAAFQDMATGKAGTVTYYAAKCSWEEWKNFQYCRSRLDWYLE